MIQTTLRLPDELYKALRAEAKKRGGIDKVYHNWCAKLWTAREGGSVEWGPV